MLRMRNKLRPKLGLPTENVMSLHGIEARHNRLKCINLFERQESADRLWLPRLQLGLVMIQISVAIGAHDDVMAGLRRRDATLDPAPGHDRGTRRQPSLKDLVPTNQPPPFRDQISIELLN